MAVLLNWSSAVTVKLNGDAAVVLARRALTTKWVARRGADRDGAADAVMLLVAVSVAVSVWLPAVLSVT